MSVRLTDLSFLKEMDPEIIEVVLRERALAICKQRHSRHFAEGWKIFGPPCESCLANVFKSFLHKRLAA